MYVCGIGGDVRMSYSTPYSVGGGGLYGSPSKSTLYPPSGMSYGPGSPGASHGVPELPVSDILYGYGEWRDVQVPRPN